MIGPSGSRNDPAPPFGRSWTRLYAAVLAALAIQVVVYDLLSRLFR